ncbi:MAG: HAMP domain-containing histidine kinase [Actinomycetota bacterium]|nr:HAMP domain-containing histidine kinase [Actinomycetota bacterium]
MRFSLRTRVLAATLVLVVLGLGVAGVATYGFLRSFLVHRLDQQLIAVEDPVEHTLGQGFGGPGPGGPGNGILSKTYAAFLDSSGKVVISKTYCFPYGCTGNQPSPALPTGLPGSSNAGSSPASRTFTASAAGTSGPDFRVLAYAAAIVGSDVRGTLVIAFPLTEINGTLHRLVLVELAVAAGVLVAVGGLGWWAVRVGLRPLDRMAETAGAIAAGDLSQRVEPDDSQTEVGRLGSALNTMLGRIEESFDRQRASEERLRQFVADASHELRTPITSIRGYAELFRRGAAQRPDDLERAMRRIEDEGARMGVLVEDLLLLARLDQGRPLERKPVDLSALAADAVADFRVADPGRPVELVTSGPAVVAGDDVRLCQVIANILDNARQHTPADTPVTVRVGEADGTATIEVADQGPGLPPEEEARVFERFYRGDPSRSRGSGGTGLGLSIAAAIVEAHGGRIAVSTQPGHGATFTVSLPVISPTVEAPTAAEAPAIPAPPPEDESRHPAADVGS